MSSTTVIWWTVAALFTLWIAGIVANFGSSAHVLFWLAVTLGVANLVTGRSRT